MATLTLPVKGIYFDAIVEGTKREEYRLATEYWQKRLEGRTYDAVEMTKGYPATGDSSRRSKRKWRGFTRKIIKHPHFGTEPVDVYAIDVSVPLSPTL